MKQIAILPAEPWEAERERVESLASRLTGYDIIFIDWYGQTESAGITLPNLRIETPRSARVFRRRRRMRFAEKAASRADVILTTGPYPEDRVALYGKPLLFLPEGVDFEAFHGASERNLPFPGDLFTVKNPIIGHSGPVDEGLNLSYVRAAAEAHPEWAFVFVGPVRTGVSAWQAYPNIHLLGEKPPHHLPAYISRFDVCINIAGSDAASPKGLYAYLAAGKPIVSAPHPAQALDYTEVAYLAGTPEEFITCCKKAIGERDAWKVRRRVEYGRAASWDARAAELERMIKELSL
ncbi:MAG: hypothetical protein LBH95_02685 [Oscillospiraceae bacterium]|jgi:glycosyltransferase involved in cell wall biosynthesis|nr:hypothetical protein [Oscillospiraceae bacterium]